LRKLIVYSHFWKSDEEIDEWFNSKRLFFILSIGRSGTKWLANLLNKALRALVVHEPFIEAIPHQEAFHDPKKEIYLRVHNHDIDIYGEVNSFLRRHCEALRKAFPNAIILHLVRDGREVIRSIYSRETMLSGAYDTKYVCPKPEDPYHRKWDKMTCFKNYVGIGHREVLGSLSIL